MDAGGRKGANLARRQLKLHFQRRVVQKLVQLVQRIIDALVRNGKCDRGGCSLGDNSECGSIEGSTITVVVTELHHATSVIQRENVCTIEKMIAITNITKRKLHVAEHSERVGILRAQAIGNCKPINQRGYASAVAAADAMKYLQTRHIFKVSAISMGRDI
jgi:hypothetical protein